MKPVKLATYLDEAGEDPASSCLTCVKHEINYVALRQLWANNVQLCTDDGCTQIHKMLKDNNLSVVLLASDIGLVTPAADLMKLQVSLRRLLDLAFYFKSPMIRVGVGLADKSALSVVREWMQFVQERCIEGGITPVLEVSHGCSLFNTIDLVTTISKYRRWKLLYDPAQLIVRQAMDPFVKYWPLIKPYVAAIDVHDYKIGHGHKPVGYGDAKIVQTMRDASSFMPECWYMLEPALGRKYGSALTKSDVFKLGYDAMVALEEKK